MTVQRKWREWLTAHLIDYWAADERYARLAQIQGEAQIPEYRIAEDTRIATDAPIDFALGLVSSLLTAIIFIQVLWNVGGDAAFSLFGYRLWIPGYLVVSVVVYSGIVTTAMVLVGAPLTRMVVIKDQAEAELITAAHLLRDIGEGVTPKLKEPEVKRGLWQALQNTIDAVAAPVLAARAQHAGVARKLASGADHRARAVRSQIPGRRDDAR